MNKSSGAKKKVYIHFDKNIYATGDTIGFKLYIFYAPSLNLSAQSVIVYLDVYLIIIKKIKVTA
ncbi:hypothetical protein DIU31_021620 [Mucilaginibacter rubeus]|uniref:Uncharacterized protein n=1 Tax=Mucilaginibacter rubeus TaxID=2027860 RepID=A0AAE6JI60_9SPHI|nr:MULTISPECIES: hypothetical protein [Mucilaginibacter]QEM05980.1 hypothetical protein DIU31_021620 [Mucilaginibacter rubeus]QTE63956.1 hypothetical protein J3L22_02730 [Mucilaginibacter rubeus]